MDASEISSSLKFLGTEQYDCVKKIINDSGAAIWNRDLNEMIADVAVTTNIRRNIAVNKNELVIILNSTLNIHETKNNINIVIDTQKKYGFSLYFCERIFLLSFIKFSIFSIISLQIISLKNILVVYNVSMSYDLSRLDASEFENLCNDILEREIGIRFQRFSIGPDGGIDGYNAEKNIVMQAKHYIKSNISDANLKLEKGKMDVKKPKKYFYFTSESITLKRKEEIKDIISPYIKGTDDIWGFEDIQSFLSKTENFDIVKKYNSLFVYSIEVLNEVFKNISNQPLLNRTKIFIEELKENIDRYIKTSDFYKALKKLEEDNVVLITGEAGIGKTTLSKLLSLEYIKEKWFFYEIADIKELESIDIDNDDKIIFYFDDFLGQNFLEAIKNNEDSRIVSFLNKIKRSKNKKFILNSRVVLAEPLYIALQMAGYEQDAHELVNHKIIPEVQKTEKTMVEVLMELQEKDSNLKDIVANIPSEVLELLSHTEDYIGDAKEKSQEIIDYAKNVIKKLK